MTIKAQALKQQSRVGLVCPAGRPVGPQALEKAQAIVRDMGFVPVLGKHVLRAHGYMAGTDAERLEDLMAFIRDDSIAAIFFLAGGFGSMHLIPYLDYKYISDHPKILLGSDDNTSLLLAIHARTGLITFHGPNICELNSRYSFDRLKSAVTRSGVLAPVTCEDTRGEDFVRPYVYAPVKGHAEGVLLGGNLTALMSLMGTPYEPNFREKILFLEDKNERNDMLDRWLTTLFISGKLGEAKALLFGKFENCGPKGAQTMLSIEDLFTDRLVSMLKPSCFGMPLGQSKETATIPVGIKAKVDTHNGRLEFSEGALV